MWNNGDGVPVEVHKEEKVYVPELIFGHLLTSSNYDDNEQKVVAINRLVCSAQFQFQHQCLYLHAVFGCMAICMMHLHADNA